MQLLGSVFALREFRPLQREVINATLQARTMCTVAFLHGFWHSGGLLVVSQAGATGYATAHTHNSLLCLLPLTNHDRRAATCCASCPAAAASRCATSCPRCWAARVSPWWSARCCPSFKTR